MIQTIVKNTNNFVIVNTDSGSVFFGDPEIVHEYPFTAGGSDVDFEVGTVVGLIAATGVLAKCTSAAVDGSQLPLGVVSFGKTVAAGTTDTIPVALKGKVRADKLIFQGADTIDTNVSGRRYRERLWSDAHIEVVSAQDNTVNI